MSSIRIALESPPEFYTNLDLIRGQVILSLSRPEQVGAVIVKLEGESRTALAVPDDSSGVGIPARNSNHSGDVLNENHKILYKVSQVFPEENAPPVTAPIILPQGQHRFSFQFKFPFNNVCGNTEAMSKIGGVVPSSSSAAAGLFGFGGIRVMDGARQLMYTHTTKTLPPSFTGFPGQAEIRYYVKVTVQRPGLFKENWRYQIGLKFLPIEPPRPAKTNQEAYARRPFAFRPRSPRPTSQRKTSFFSGSASSRRAQSSSQSPSLGGPPSPSAVEPPPSVEISARLPYPAILTCNKPIPLRLIAKKLVASQAEVYLVAIQMDLVAHTTIRAHNLINTEVQRWVIMSRQGLSILVSRPDDAVGTEFVVPDTMWNNIPLPNTVVPDFVTCNLSRTHQVELKLGLCWGKPTAVTGTSSSFFKSKNRLDMSDIPQEVHLPLHFSNVSVDSGLAPPQALVEAMRTGGKRRRKPVASRPSQSQQQQQQQQASPRPPTSVNTPPLPPRPAQPQQQQQQVPLQPVQQQSTVPVTSDPLYPPQLAPGQSGYEDPPPTYEEAMAEEMTGPMFPATARPAYSGVTNENEPSTLPEKN